MSVTEQLEHFFDEGLIESVIRPIKSGKEASVHLCRGNPRTTGEDLLALKLYHPLDRRDFRDESMYRDGEWIKARRVRVALEKKTAFGREVQGMIWVDREWETLGALSEGGVPVPRPIERTGDAILMTYVGDEQLAAPQLRSYRPSDPEEARAIVDQVLDAIQRMLFLNVVHGDLSPYNLLIWNGIVTVIDVPQAVDPRKNRHARSFLQRDIERIGEMGRSPRRSDTRRSTGRGLLDIVGVRRPDPRGASRPHHVSSELAWLVALRVDEQADDDDEQADHEGASEPCPDRRGGGHPERFDHSLCGLGRSVREPLPDRSRREEQRGRARRDQRSEHDGAGTAPAAATPVPRSPRRCPARAVAGPIDGRHPADP